MRDVHTNGQMYIKRNREIDRLTGWHKSRQTDRQIDTDKSTDGRTDGRTDKCIEGQALTKTDRYKKMKDRQTDTTKDSHTARETHRLAERHRSTAKHTDEQTNTLMDR